MERMSEAEETFAHQLDADGLPTPTREFRFHPVRRWRFDFCWIRKMVAVEIDGGSWISGRHTRGGGFEKDCEKYTQAAILGWSVLRVTPKMVQNGSAIEFIKEALRARRVQCKTCGTWLLLEPLAKVDVVREPPTRRAKKKRDL